MIRPTRLQSHQSHSGNLQIPAGPKTFLLSENVYQKTNFTTKNPPFREGRILEQIQNPNHP